MEQNKKPRKKPGPPKGVKGVRIVLTPEQVAQCETYAKVGLTYDQIAAILEVSPTTFDEILKRQDEVGRAVKKGRAQGIYQMGGTLYQRGMGRRNPATGEYIEKPDMTAAIFWLKCQAGWVEKKDNGDTAKEDPYEPPDSLVDDEDDDS